MSVRSDPRVGTELAGYRIEALLGRGGMADVYRAVDSRLGRRVALKLLAPDLAEDERFRERFLRESRLAASLDHPNVIPIYEAGEVEGLLFIAMRFVEGTDLRELLQREGKLEPRRALFLLGRVADALDAAHARGLVHRDVKPGNVLIAVDPKADPPEHPYLSDFGLTKQTTSDSGITQTGQFVGTADYAAPEQITRQAIGPATDQYALACLLYECLTGAPPYRNEALMAVLWAHVNDRPPKATEHNPELPRPIDGVLARGLAKEPKQRYGSCRELVGAARDALGVSGELPQAAAAATPLYRRREFLIGAGVLVVAAVAAPAVLLTRGNGGGAPGLAPRNSVARIDPETNEITRVVADLPPPWTLAVGEGLVWSLSRESGNVTRIDPVTGATTTTPVPGLPYSIAAGEGSVWVTTSFEGQGYLLALSPQTGRLDSRYLLPYPDPLGVTTVDGSVWVAYLDSLRGRSVFHRYPPQPQLEEGTVVPSGPEILVPERFLWSTITDWFAMQDDTITMITYPAGSAPFGTGTSLHRLDMTTGEDIEPIPLQGPLALAVVGSSTWVTGFPRRVWDVSSTSEVTAHDGLMPRDSGPILYAHDSLWIGDAIANSLTRVDPSTGQAIGELQVAEPQPAEALSLLIPSQFFATAPYLTGLRADDQAIWALVGGYPGNL
jgi:serine/threonine-protein kinase